MLSKIMSRYHAASILLSTVLSLCVLGCAQISERPSNALDCNGDISVETRLYFGRSISNGGFVNDNQWNAFAMREITPRFPGGFTLIDGSGVWEGCTPQNGACEKTKILIVAHAGTKASHSDLDAIATNYGKSFAQFAVLRTDAQICFTLIKPNKDKP